MKKEELSSKKTEFNTSSNTEVFPEHVLTTSQGFFGNPENFVIQSGTQYSSLNFDDNDEFSAVKNDTSDLLHLLPIFHPVLQCIDIMNPVH